MTRGKLHIHVTVYNELGNLIPARKVLSLLCRFQSADVEARTARFRKPLPSINKTVPSWIADLALPLINTLYSSTFVQLREQRTLRFPGYLMVFTSYTLLVKTSVFMKDLMSSTLSTKKWICVIFRQQS